MLFGFLEATRPPWPLAIQKIVGDGWPPTRSIDIFQMSDPAMGLQVGHCGIALGSSRGEYAKKRAAVLENTTVAAGKAAQLSI